MHPSVFASESAYRPRRVAHKRERRASCSAASPSMSSQSKSSPSKSSSSMSYHIPSFPKIERRSSFSSSLPLPLGSSHSTHRRIERRSSCSSSLPFGSSHSKHRKNERRSSCSSTASLSDSHSSLSSTSSTKSCSFREDVVVINFQAPIPLTGDNRDLWYQKDDFDNFRKKTQRIINNVDENGRGKNGKKYCTRGLEKYMVQHAQESSSILGALDEDESASFTEKSDAHDGAITDEKKQTSFRTRILSFRRKSE